MDDHYFEQNWLLALMSAKLDDIDTKLKNAIATRIKELRASSGKKQNQFAADNLDIDKQNLQRLEAGRGASIYTIHKICKALGISLSDFFDSSHFD